MNCPDIRHELKVSASVVSLTAAMIIALPGIAGAQDASNVEQIVVTGSRLTTGIQTPTPVTAVSSEQLTNSSPSDIQSSLAQLPVFNNSIPNTSVSTGAVGGTTGQALLNLRGLGNNRGLVLLNGRRVVATNTEGSVDINTLPQKLVERVDVVTGGASAAYGSDAVAGVINFVLNTKFEGLKGDIGGGISTYGDRPTAHASLAYGGAFLNNKLHVIASTEFTNMAGIGWNEKHGRDWYEDPAGLVPNSVGAPPANLVLPHIRSAVGTFGGLINSSAAGAPGSANALKGTQFLAGGQPAPFNYGYDAGSVWQSGGDGAYPGISLAGSQTGSNNFVHAEYDLTPTIYAYGELGYSVDHSYNNFAAAPEVGGNGNFTIYSGNPFIPASIQSVMTARNIPSFTLGRYLSDFPLVGLLSNVAVMREAVGVKGMEPFGLSNWQWETSYSSGQTNQVLAETNLPISRNIFAAADAVTNPATGQIVCRSTIYNAAGVFVPGGTGMDAGCKPLNLFGVGSVDPAAAAWSVGNSTKTLSLRQNVWQANLSGDFGEDFQVGAGRISFATGVEYRQESALQTSDALSQAFVDFTGMRGGPVTLSGKQGQFKFYNPQPFSGHYDVKEIYGELGIPLLKDEPFARSLNANVAARYTDYSQSGGVTTWKYGLDYQIIDDVRLRGTASQDIRAPNLVELFDTGTQSTQFAFYPSSANGTLVPNTAYTVGNAHLKPEAALTYTYGMVLTPTFLDGFNMSVDYYDIRLKGAIGSTSIQNIVDFCAAGQQSFCSLVTYSNGLLKVISPTMNLQVREEAGFDFEASYTANLFNNPLSVRLLATNETKNYTQAVGSGVVQSLGGPTAPPWKATLQLNYAMNDWSFYVGERYTSEVKMDPTKQVGVYTNNNSVPRIFYTDFTVNYNMELLDTRDQLYLTVQNLFDQKPPTVAVAPLSWSQPTSAIAYDTIGRVFNIGVRFKM